MCLNKLNFVVFGLVRRPDSTKSSGRPDSGKSGGHPDSGKSSRAHLFSEGDDEDDLFSSNSAAALTTSTESK